MEKSGRAKTRENVTQKYQLKQQQKHKNQYSKNIRDRRENIDRNKSRLPTPQ